MIALLTALGTEAEGFISKTVVEKIDYWNGYKILIGYFSGEECIIASTGIGKVHAAVVTSHIIDQYRPAAVFYTGIAGSLRDNLNIGDVIIAEDCIQWDVNLTSFGFKIGELPAPGSNHNTINNRDSVRLYNTDPELLSKAAAWNPRGFKVKTGRIITGDSFFVSSLFAQNADLLKELDGDAVDMEGAAAGSAARMHTVPFFMARVISDTPEGRKPKRFKQFVKESSNKMADLVEHIFITDFS